MATNAIRAFVADWPGLFCESAAVVFIKFVSTSANAG